MKSRSRRPVAPLLLMLAVLIQGHAAPSDASTVPPRTAPARATPRRTPRALHFAPGEVVVIAEEGAVQLGADGTPRSPNAGAMGALNRLGLTWGRGIDPTPRPSGTRRERVWLLRSARPDFDPVAASRSLQSTGAFRAVCPNFNIGLLSTTPNDPFLPYQWHVDDGGFADVRLPQAWDVARGDTSVVIAILDTGVDTSHPDLASQIWHNLGEIPGNGLDDDGNGLVDDVEGWDFGSGDNDPKPEYTADASGFDAGFHGTFCAGIAAAATNNEDGIAGAGWNCRIMPLKASLPDSGLTASGIAGGVAYAVDEGASVISMSFGAADDTSGVVEFFQTLVDMATAGGVLCVAAAGNDGDSTLVYPAACDHVLSVAATDFDNARASFSNWGPSVDIAAPGSSMFSTLSQNYQFALLDQLLYLLSGWDGLNPYMFGDGTSFSCPLVAGVCGLVRARFPYLSPAAVAQHVIATGDVVAFDHPIGTKLNAFRAVSDATTGVEVDAQTPVPSLPAATPNPFEGSTDIRFTLPADGWARLVIYDAAGRRVRTLADGTMSAGIHRVRWDGRSDRGTRASSAVYFARLEGQGIVRSTKVVLVGR